MEKSMVKTLKFIYVIIFIISSTGVEALFKVCYTNFDCPRSMCMYPSIVRCVEVRCQCVDINDMMRLG
ncbi:unnamed protein product [Lathyrus oleraceus]